LLEINKVYQGDCLEIMKNIPDNSIDMVLTSPPYDNLRTYNNSLEWGEHIWKPIIQELYRIVKKGGVVVWVVGDATIKGSETGTSFKQALYAKKCGFNLHDTMIWNKGNFTAVGALKTSYAPVFEYMFIFSKGKVKTFNPIKDRPNKHFGEKYHQTVRQPNGKTKDGHGKGEKKITKFGQRHNVWLMPPEQSNKKRCHPAQFPEQIAYDHIYSWSNKGDIILDPMAGSGTVGKMAKQLGRNYILIEKEPEYVEICEKRLAENSCTQDQRLKN
jgi:site-specific DNA-methyltransferase (adenine-specific)